MWPPTCLLLMLKFSVYSFALLKNSNNTYLLRTLSTCLAIEDTIRNYVHIPWQHHIQCTLNVWGLVWSVARKVYRVLSPQTLNCITQSEGKFPKLSCQANLLPTHSFAPQWRYYERKKFIDVLSILHNY